MNTVKLSVRNFVVPLDKSAPTDVTAIIGCAVMTGCGAVLNTARVQTGDSVVVIGVGGVGLAAVQAAANVSAFPIIAVDVADDKLALADRFGLSLGFHVVDQPTYLAIVEGYAQAHGLAFDPHEAVSWATQRGARSGRVAWQYVVELAGRSGKTL